MASAAAPSTIHQETFQLILRRTALFLGILMSGGHLFLPRLPMFAMILMIFLVSRNPAQLLRREFATVWWLLLAVLLVALIGGGGMNPLAFANRYAIFFAALFLLGIYGALPRRVFVDDLMFMLRIMAIQAILTVVLAFGMPKYFTMLVYQDTVYRTMLLLFTYHDVLADAGPIKRADGFFFEPGVLQIYLNIFLYLALFLRRNLCDIAIAILGVISTQSTMGFAVASLLLGAAYLQRVHSVGASAKVIVTMFLPLLVLPILWLGFNNYIDKTQGTLRGSTWAREFDLQTGLRVAAKYPLTGIGFDIERYREASQRFGYRETILDFRYAAERINSNGIVSLAFTVGIPLFIVFMIGLYRQRFFPHRIIIGLALTMCFLNEALMLTPFFLMLMFSGLLNNARAQDVASRMRNLPPSPSPT